MESNQSTLEALGAVSRVAFGSAKGGEKFGSVRRVLRILDLVSQQKGLTAKSLARELDVSLSSCYCLIKILIEEGYLEKVSPGGGYVLGKAISTLHERRRDEALFSAAQSANGEAARGPEVMPGCKRLQVGP